MMKECRHIAIDLGGGSGRVIAGDGRGALEVVHRFPNRQVESDGHLRWDFSNLMSGIIEGLRLAASRYRLASVGVDTWGVDVGFVDSSSRLLEPPVCYRDPATAGLAAQSPTLYETTGIQPMDINTLHQLRALAREGHRASRTAAAMLFTPDLVSVLLGAEPYSEYTIASTSQMLDARSRDWAPEAVEACGLPAHALQRVVMPGTRVGSLSPATCAAIGVDYEVPIIAVAAHDTASAYYAVAPEPGEQPLTAILSSGTWSLLGVIVDEPALTPEALAAGLSNEGMPGGRIALLQNITGMWVLERLLAGWREQSLPTDYATILAMAEESAFDGLVEIDDPDFAKPVDMAAAVQSRFPGCEMSRGDIVRCILRSLADRYRRGVSELEGVIGRRIGRLRIIGGGSQNALLNRLTAEATGLPVEAGPVEATAMGNIKLQHETMTAKP